MRRSAFSLTFLLLTAASSQVALAGPYLSAAAAYSDRNSYARQEGFDLEEALGLRVQTGYRFSDIPLFIEAGYIDSGNSDISRRSNGADVASVRLRAFQVAIGGGVNLSPLGSAMWLKGGYYIGQAMLESPSWGSSIGDSDNDSVHGATIGLGGVWKANSWFGLRFEAEKLFGVDEPRFSDADMMVYSAGVVLEIPVRGRSSKAVDKSIQPSSAHLDAIRSTSASQPEPSATAQPEPVAEAPAPAGPAAEPTIETASALASGAHRMRLLAAMPFRDSPKRETAAKATLPIGTVLVLRNRVTNADGDWWFVQTDTDIGWIPVGP